MQSAKPYLEPSVERGVLVLTILRQQIEGEDLALGLKDELLATVAHYDLPKVVLDLKNTRYVSSIAFWPLLALRRQLGERGGRLIVCGLTGAVHEVFTTTKMVSSAGSLNAPFEMAPDRESAVALLAEDVTPPDTKVR
jgi:anti-anti-sigma factor